MVRINNSGVKMRFSPVCVDTDITKLINTKQNKILYCNEID